MYVHLPFCRSVCSYCDYVVASGDQQGDAYFDSLLRELDDRCESTEGRRLRSVYFGGGTPSLAPVSWVERLLDRITSLIDGRPLQVTLEANPEDVTSERLTAWVEAGVTRLVIGVQSFEPRVLDVLGRRHDPERAEEALTEALATEELDVGVDLIFGAPDQAISDLENDLDRLRAIGRPEAVFGFEYRTDDWEGEGEEVADMLELLVEASRSMGFVREGVSSFCRRGKESRQALGYRTGWEYLGLGVGASSLEIDASGAVSRRRNRPTLPEYLAPPSEPGEAVPVEPDEFFQDRLALGMRTSAGVDWQVVQEQFADGIGVELLERGRRSLEWSVAQGLAEREGEAYYPTDRGFDLADGVARAFRDRLEVDSDS